MGKRGKPPKEVDPAIVLNMAKLHCTYAEIGSVVGLSEREMQRRFKDLVNEGHLQGKSSLRNLQWNGAKKGSAAMLIWLGKQYLGQTDKVETKDVDAKKPTKVEIIWNVAAPKEGATEYGYDAPPVGTAPTVPGDGTT